MISRAPFLTYVPLSGQFRYRDRLQIIPPKPEDPRPDTRLGWHGATLAVAYAEEPAPTRSIDVWAHDHRERQRIEFLTSSAQKNAASQEWLEAAIKQQGIFYRRPAIEQEAFRLLQVLSNNYIQRPRSDYGWYLESDNLESDKPVYGRSWYPSLVADGWGEFWNSTHISGIPLVEPREHFGRIGFTGDEVFTLPSDLESRLDDYFALSPERMITFARVCELFGCAQEIWPISRSLSLASYVFAVDALSHVDDPQPKICPECQNLLALETCGACGGPRFGLTRRFRDFVHAFISDKDEKRFATDLFRVRSGIAHRGKLLRSDEFDAGFHVGKSDGEHNFNVDVGRVVQKVLRGWLSSTHRSAPGSEK